MSASLPPRDPGAVCLQPGAAPPPPPSRAGQGADGGSLVERGTAARSCRHISCSRQWPILARCLPPCRPLVAHPSVCTFCYSPPLLIPRPLIRVLPAPSHTSRHTERDPPAGKCARNCAKLISLSAAMAYKQYLCLVQS